MWNTPRSWQNWMLLTFIMLATPMRADVAAVAPHAGRAEPNWQTICHDRFLLEVPSDVEVASSAIAYRSVYQLVGINDRGSLGPVWGGMEIIETVPTDAAGFGVLKEGAAVESADDEIAQRGAIDAAKDQIEDWELKVKTSTTKEDIVYSQEFVAKGKAKLAAAQDAIRLSGRSQPDRPDSYAIRRDQGFSLGYLDKSDRRARTFTGKLSNPKIVGPASAAHELELLMRSYRARKPVDIPAGPGFCTPHGFFPELTAPDKSASTKIMFRSQRYPNLIFTLEVAPSVESRNIQALPDVAAAAANLGIFNIKRSFGPVAVDIVGAPGRLVGQEYKMEACSEAVGCSPTDQAYEFEAETYGQKGNPLHPTLMLNMQAVLSDDYKSKQSTLPGNEKALEVQRGALKGFVPPNVAQGRAIFERVLKSIRVRPGAIVEETGSSDM